MSLNTIQDIDAALKELDELVEEGHNIDDIEEMRKYFLKIRSNLGKPKIQHLWHSRRDKIFFSKF